MLLISGGEGNTTHLCEKLSHRDIDGDHISVTGCLEVMQAREGLNNQLSNSTLSLLNTIHQLGTEPLTVTMTIAMFLKYTFDI